MEDVLLMRGDCLELMSFLPDRSIDMVMCDLPYGTTQNAWDSVLPLDQLWAHYWRVCKGAVVLTAQCPFDKVLGVSCLKFLKYEWVWVKNTATGFLNAKKAPLKNIENILVFYKEKTTYFPQMRQGHKAYKVKQGRKSTNYGHVEPGHVTESDGVRYPLSSLEFSQERPRIHPTQKPVALMDYLIRTYTNPGDVVLDNCMGSGTTGVAALECGRRFVGIEKDETYFQIAEKRIRGCDAYRCLYGDD